MEMNDVICSSTGSVVDKSYCQTCALNVPPCGFDYALIKRVHKALEPRGGVHVTDLVHCLRRSFYERTDPVPERVSDVMYRILGTATHSILEGMEDENLIAEMSLEHEGVVGTVDSYYPKHKRLVDHKTTRWLVPAKLPYGDHEMQVNVYRWLLVNNGYEVDRMYLHYIDLSGPTKCRKCKLPLTENGGLFACDVCGSEYNNAHHGAVILNVPTMLIDEVDTFVMERKAMLKESLKTGKMPEATPGFLCNYCQFKSICPDSEARE